MYFRNVHFITEMLLMLTTLVTDFHLLSIKIKVLLTIFSISNVPALQLHVLWNDQFSHIASR